MKRITIYVFIVYCFLVLNSYGKEVTLQADNASEESHKVLLVVMYHHLTENEEEWNRIRISPAKFKEDMVTLKKEGYESVLPKDIISFINGKGKLPKKPVLITFDDGYESNYKYAYPILKETKMKAVIGVIGSKVGDKKLVLPRFTWKQAKEMYNSGLVSIQPHSFDLHKGVETPSEQGVRRHANESTKQYKERLKEDTLHIMKLIKDNVGEDTLLYTYPYGIKTEESEEVMKELHIPITLTTKEGLDRIGEDMLSLKRYNASFDKQMTTILEEAGLKKEE